MAGRAKRGKRQALDHESLELVAKALEARARAYAPYSGYHVGAALRTKGGKWFLGCNVENASYGLCICAERVAISSAVAAGEREFAAMAIATQSVPPASPCGACRQFLSELAPEMPLWLCNPDGDVERSSVDALLPRAFAGRQLSNAPAAPRRKPSRTRVEAP